MANQRRAALPPVALVTLPHPDAATRLRLAFDLLLHAATRGASPRTPAASAEAVSPAPAEDEAPPRQDES